MKWFSVADVLPGYQTKKVICKFDRGSLITYCAGMYCYLNGWVFYDIFGAEIQDNDLSNDITHWTIEDKSND